MNEQMEVYDGNTLAGPLSEVFAVELTTAAGRCRSCGTTSVMATFRVYGPGPGFVGRCPHCEDVLLRLVRTPEASAPRRRPEVKHEADRAPQQRAGGRSWTLHAEEFSEFRMGVGAEVVQLAQVVGPDSASASAACLPAVPSPWQPSSLLGCAS